jgi:hypothetical protein
MDISLVDSEPDGGVCEVQVLEVKIGVGVMSRMLL